MSQSLPWNLRGVDAETREAARAAARAAGMSVSEWLEHVIRDSARPGTADIDDETDHLLGDRLRRLSESGSRRTLHKASRSTPADPQLDALVSLAARLEERTRTSEARTTGALESIAGWIEKAEQRMARSERAAAERQERATSVIADAIKTVSSRVNEMERRGESRARMPDAVAEQRYAAAGGGSRRPVLSRENLSQVVTDIRSRQRDLDQASAGSRPSTGGNNGRVLEWPHAERRQGDRREELTPLMNALRAEMADMRREITSAALAPAARLEDSIRDLARMLEGTRTQPQVATALVDELARPLARIEQEMRRVGAGPDQDHFARIEQQIERLGGRLESLSRSSGNEPRVMAAALGEIASLKDLLSQRDHGEATTRQLSQLARDIGDLRDNLPRQPDISAFEAALADLRDSMTRETRETAQVSRGLIERIHHQLDQVAKAVSDLPRGASDQPDLSQLSRKLDQLAARAAPESDMLARRIEELAIRLDDLPRSEPSELAERLDQLASKIEHLAARKPDDLSPRLDALTQKIDQLAARPVSTTSEGGQSLDFRPLEALLGDITRKIDQRVQVPQPDLSGLEAEIASLARRIEDAQRPGHDDAGLQALEHQIARLAERLDHRPATPADALERTLQDLMQSLGGLKDETASAVERAARNAVSDVMSATPQANAQTLDWLRDDIAGLKDTHRSIDQRTSEAIGAVSDALERVAARLGQLESRIEAASAMPRRGDVDTPPPLAAAEQPVMRPVLPERRRVEIDPPLATPEPSQDIESRPRAIEPRLPRTATADMPLEPGSGRPRPGSEPMPAILETADAGPVPTENVKANFIAAARRAAQAAALELEAAQKIEAKPDTAKRGSRLSSVAKALTSGRKSAATAAREAAFTANLDNVVAEPKQAAKAETAPRAEVKAGLKAELEKRRKPILLGLAAIVLTLGVAQVANNLLDSGPAPQPQPQRSAVTPPTVTPSPTTQTRPADTPAVATPTAITPPQAAPTPAVPAENPGTVTQPARDQSSALPAVPTPTVDTTGSTRPAAPVPAVDPLPRVTGLGELPAALGTAGMRRAAMEGDPNAVHELASRAFDGHGVPRDQRLALRLFERAAAAGHAPSQFRLGNMYEKGLGTTRDTKLAVSWYRRAADAGNAKAIHNLGVLLAEGVDGRPDYAVAADLFRRAAEFGVRDSQFNLAILLGRGLGTEQDLAQAFSWFAIAARQGDADAAKRRDEVGQRLSATDLRAAQMAADAWRAKTPDAVSNEIAAPAEGWDPQPRPQRPQQPRPRTS